MLCRWSPYLWRGLRYQFGPFLLLRCSSKILCLESYTTVSWWSRVTSGPTARTLDLIFPIPDLDEFTQALCGRTVSSFQCSYVHTSHLNRHLLTFCSSGTSQLLTAAWEAHWQLPLPKIVSPSLAHISEKIWSPTRECFRMQHAASLLVHSFSFYSFDKQDWFPSSEFTAIGNITTPGNFCHLHYFRGSTRNICELKFTRNVTLSHALSKNKRQEQGDLAGKPFNPCFLYSKITDKCSTANTLWTDSDGSDGEVDYSAYVYWGDPDESE